MRLYIFQPGGLGDIFITLPIVWIYHNNGYRVTWAVPRSHFNTVSVCAPWVNWIVFDKEPAPGRGNWYDFFEEIGLPEYLKPADDKVILDLFYTPKNTPGGTRLKFDQIRYNTANIPFTYKWILGSFLMRDSYAEEALFSKVVKSDNYVVTHLQGSNSRAEMPAALAERFTGMQIIEIDSKLTPNAVNWLKVLEGAQHLVMYDSCFSNLVDQLGFETPKSFICRSPWYTTPVLGMTWDYYDPPHDFAEQYRSYLAQKGFTPELIADLSKDVKANLGELCP